MFIVFCIICIEIYIFINTFIKLPYNLTQLILEKIKNYCTHKIF